MSESRDALYTGGCQCGAVRYAVYGEPHDAHLCHCRMCQKAVGGPFIALAPVKHEDFAWTRGKPAAYRSSSITERDFCAACGTPLSFRYLQGSGIALTIGSFDEPSRLPPRINYGVESELAWFDTIAGLKSETTDESLEPDRKAQLVSFQHPDHDTPENWRPPNAELDR